MTTESAPIATPKETLKDAPPRVVKVTAPKRADRKPKTGSRRKSLTRPLTDLITAIGTGVSLVNQADGIAIVTGAEPLAKALNNVAKDNATVYRNLERLVTGSAWGAVIMAAGSILVPIAANHDLLPFQIPGMETPTETPTGAESMPDDIVTDLGAGHAANG